MKSTTMGNATVYLLLLAAMIGTLSSFRLAIRLCFKDTTKPNIEQSECAYCDPRRLQQTMRNCTQTQDGLPADPAVNTVWAETQKRCILRTCRQQYPTQKIFPTLMPLAKS